MKFINNTDKLSRKPSKTVETNSLNSKFRKIFSSKQEEFLRLREILDKFCKDNRLSFSQLSGFLENIEDHITIPASIFYNNAPLEALTKYLKENLDYSFSKISMILERDKRTVWTTYNNAVKKNIVIKTRSEYHIPLILFKNRKLSVLEIISKYLHEEKRLTFKKISEILGKDQRTIWTCHNRAKKKLVRNEL